MSGLWSRLNSPELVFSVQNFFGVERDEEKKFRVRNKFFYYLFLLGTELGDEIFYGIFIPIVFINFDVFIGRRFVFHWFVNMFIGQALKEVFKEDRPKSPAIQMQSKWSNEFSLPSTHAMGSLSIAASILYFAIDRYGVDLWLGVFCIVLWVGVISMSRIYLGMHSVLDVVAGVFITLILLAVLLPLTNFILDFLAENLLSPLASVILPILLIVYFPTSGEWTPTRGDTCTVAAVFSGIELGTFFNYQLGFFHKTQPSYPLSLEIGNLYFFAARSILGLAIAGLTELAGKYISWSVLCFVFNQNKKVLKSSENSVTNTKKNFIDLTSKYFTYCILGFNVIVVVPLIFHYLNIQRDRYHYEL